MSQFYSESTAIIHNYYEQVSSIWDIATEADVQPNPSAVTGSTEIRKDNALQSGNVGDTGKDGVLKKISYILKKMQAWLGEFMTRMKNYSKRVWQSDRKFEEEYKQIKASRKPAQSVKVIKYEYDNQTLDHLMAQVINMVKTIYSDAKSDAAIGNKDFCLLRGKKETEQHIIATITKNIPQESGQEVDNIRSLFILMKKTYRKEKKEVMITSSQIGIYEQGLGEAKKAMNRVNSVITTMKTMSSDLDQFCKARISGNTKIEHSSDYEKIMTNFSTVYSFFINFSHYYYDLKTEYQFCCREVLRKLYQF